MRSECCQRSQTGARRAWDTVRGLASYFLLICSGRYDFWGHKMLLNLRATFRLTSTKLLLGRKARTGSTFNPCITSPRYWYKRTISERTLISTGVSVPERGNTENVQEWLNWLILNYSCTFQGHGNWFPDGVCRTVRDERPPYMWGIYHSGA